MATFAVRTPISVEIMDFMEKTNHRLKNVHDFSKNPFKDPFVKLLPERKNNVYYFSMNPILPKAYKLGYIVLIFTFLFTGLSWWLLPGLFILSFSFFWHDRFFFLMLKLSLKKANIEEKIILLNKEEALLNLLMNKSKLRELRKVRHISAK